MNTEAELLNEERVREALAEAERQSLALSERARALQVCWRNLLPSIPPPSEERFLMWARVRSTDAMLDALQKASRRVATGPRMSAEHVHRYVSGIATARDRWPYLESRNKARLTQRAQEAA